MHKCWRVVRSEVSPFLIREPRVTMRDPKRIPQDVILNGPTDLIELTLVRDADSRADFSAESREPGKLSPLPK